jgi:N-acetylmuramoyl-L-alanine amidase
VKRKKALPQRTVVVFSTLAGVLSLTSVFLLLLAPAPLTPGPAESLFAVDSPDSLATIFQTHKSLENWQYIYIHQSSGLPSGTMAGDHFLIGNGTNLAEGELQIGQRWLDQASAVPPAGAVRVAPNCICICIAGDFDQTIPTPTQLRRLAELTASLQSRLQIPADHILFVDHARTAAGIGQYFPIAAFRQQLGG